MHFKQFKLCEFNFEILSNVEIQFSIYYVLMIKKFISNHKNSTKENYFTSLFDSVVYIPLSCSIQHFLHNSRYHGMGKAYYIVNDFSTIFGIKTKKLL